MLREASKRKVLSNPPLWGHFFKASFAAVKKAKVNYCMGFFACLMVVFVVALLSTVLSKAPLIFLRLSELTHGETDVLLSAGEWTGHETINFTKFMEVLPNTSASPRYVMPAYWISDKRCSEKGNDPWNTTWKYTGGGKHCDPFAYVDCFSARCGLANFPATVHLIDSDREKEMRLGRMWPYPRIPKASCYMVETLAEKFNITEGDIIYAGVSTYSIFHPLGQRVSPKVPVRIYLPLTVAVVYPKPYGKHPHDNEDVLLLEYSDFLPHVVDQIPEYYLESETLESIKKQANNFYEHAQSVHLNLPPPRIDAYLNSNYDEIQEAVISYANPIFFKLGWNQIATGLPVLEGLSKTKLISLFLGLILDLIIFILLSLSILLIYSLLLINVDSRTFEIGVMRMIGSQRTGVIMMLLSHAFLYAIPSWFFGLGLAQVGAISIKAGVGTLLGIEDVSPILTIDGVALGCFLGLLAPVLASILPIRSALGKNLHDSLDTRQSKTQAVKVEISRSDQGSSIPWDMVTIGFALALFGASIYYGLPLALLTLNLGILINIFFFLLVGMLLGMVLLCLNLQNFVETAIIKLFFFWENRAVRAILSKNLIAHRPRNRKTSIMYALSLGFIIFISIASTIQIQTIEYAKQQSHGVYMEAISYTFRSNDGERRSLREAASHLEKFARLDPRIEDFAWVSEDLATVMQPLVTETMATHNGDIYTRNGVKVYAVSPNIFDVTIPGFLNVAESKYEDSYIARGLYQEDGYGGALVPSLYKKTLGLTIGKDFLISFKVQRQTNRNQMEATAIDGDSYSYNLPLRAEGFISAAPGFRFSPFPLVTRQNILVSFPTFISLTSGKCNSTKDVPLSRFLIKVRTDMNTTSKDSLKRYLNDITSGTGWIFDYQQDVEPLQLPTLILNYIFSLTTLIAMFICFFSLMSSMFTNVYEQTKEIGVLRAIGVSTLRMRKVYIYEAFVLVLASSLLGVFIGLVIGYAMTLQQSLFTQFPIPFNFPWPILLTVLFGSMLFSLFASWTPINHVVGMRVVQIFRYV